MINGFGAKMLHAISSHLRKKKIGLRKMENKFYIHTTIFVMKWLAGFICLFNVFCATTQDIMSVQYKIYESSSYFLLSVSNLLSK